MDVFDHRHSVHSTYLGVLIEIGFVGLLLLLALVLLVTRGYRFARQVDDGGRSLMMAMAVIAMIAVCLYGIATFGLRQRIFWLMAGMLLAAVNIIERDRRSRFVGKPVSGSNHVSHSAEDKRSA